MHCRPKVEGRPVDQNHTVPTGRNLFVMFTRHFVPGYFHLVPARNASRSDAGRASGTKPSTPVYEIDSTPPPGFEHEDEDENLRDL
jgi:hypothetical protein